MKYVIHLRNGKLKSYQRASEEYLEKHKDDPSNPANKPGAKVVDSIEGYERWTPPAPVSEKTRILKALGLTQAHLTKIKEL